MNITSNPPNQTHAVQNGDFRHSDDSHSDVDSDGTYEDLDVGSEHNDAHPALEKPTKLFAQKPSKYTNPRSNVTSTHNSPRAPHNTQRRMMPSSSSTRVGIVEKKSPMSRTQGISANSEAFILEKPSSAPRSTHNLLKQFLVDAHKPCHKDFGYSGPTSNHSSQRQIHTLSTIQRSHKRLPEVSIDLPLYTNSRQLGSGASSKERALSISESRTSLGKLKVVSPQILDGEMSFPVTARASGHQFTYPFLQPASGDAVVYGAAIHVPFPRKIKLDQSGNSRTLEVQNWKKSSEKEPRSRQGKKEYIEQLLAGVDPYRGSNAGRSRSPEEAKAHVEELLSKGKNIKERQKKLVKEQRARERQELTFQPYIGAGSGGQHREFAEFLSEQNKFVETQQANRLKAKAELERSRRERDSVSPPHVSVKSRQIVEASRKKANDSRVVYERLQDFAKVAKKSTDNKDNMSSNFIGNTTPTGSRSPTGAAPQPLTDFKPRINKRETNGKQVKRGKIDDILYNDALRRVRASQRRETKQEIPEYKVHINETSTRMLAERLIREFEEHSEVFFKPNSEHRFNYLQMCEFMKMLKFVIHAEDTKNEYFLRERTLLYDMWLVLRGEEYSGVNERNLLLFLLGILELNFDLPPYIRAEHTEITATPLKPDGDSRSGRVPSPTGRKALSYSHSPTPDKPQNKGIVQSSMNLHPQHTPNSTSNGATPHKMSPREFYEKTLEKRSEYQSPNMSLRIGADHFGSWDTHENIHLTSEEVTRIHKVYQLFHTNRATVTMSTPKPKVIPRQQSRSPEILEHSRILADEYRQKQLAEVANFMLEASKNPPSDGRLTHADLLRYQKEAKTHKMQESSLQRQQEKLTECTFKPTINDTGKVVKLLRSHAASRENTPRPKNQNPESFRHLHIEGSGSRLENLGVKRTEELYSLRKAYQTKPNKSYADSSHDKISEEHTFKPNLQASARSITRKTSLENVRDAERSIERVRKAREQKEFINWFKNERMPFNPEKDAAPTSFKCGIDRAHNNKFVNRLEGKTSVRNSTKLQYSMRKESNNSCGISQTVNPTPFKQSQDLKQSRDISYRDVSPTAKPTTHTSTPDSEPLLFIDVNFREGETDRIVVYEGDDPNQLAENFGIEKNLNEKMVKKLKAVLVSQMQQLLAQKDESDS